MTMEGERAREYERTMGEEKNGELVMIREE